MAVPSVPPIPPPPQPYYWYPPPPRNDSKLIILIVVIVLVIIIVPIVLAAVLYVMVTGLIESEPRGGVVPIGPPTSCGIGCTELQIGPQVGRFALAEYTVNFRVSDVALSVGPLAPGLLYNDTQFRLSFFDANAAGFLDEGDRFRVQNSAPPADCGLSLSSRGTALSTGWTC